MAGSTKAKPLFPKLNPAHDAAVRRMLSPRPQSKKAVARVAKKKVPDLKN